MFSKNKLAELIEKSGITPNELANQTKIQKTNLARLMAGNSLSPGATTLDALSKFFKVSPSYFFDSEEQNNPTKKAYED